MLTTMLCATNILSTCLSNNAHFPIHRSHSDLTQHILFRVHQNANINTNENYCVFILVLPAVPASRSEMQESHLQVAQKQQHYERTKSIFEPEQQDVPGANTNSILEPYGWRGEHQIHPLRHLPEDLTLLLFSDSDCRENRAALHAGVASELTLR